MLTASENRSFRTWLVRLDSRLMDVSDYSLADVQSRLESSGVLPEPGLMHELCNHWRRGCSVSRAVSLVMARLGSADNPEFADPVPTMVKFGRFAAIVDTAAIEALDYTHHFPARHSVDYETADSRRAW